MLIRSALGAADKRRIQAMLFANNGGDLRQQLLDSAPIYLPLTHTAIPTRGSITPSFTRATTSTWKNNDGYLVTGVAGEIGFVGARRVRNLVLSSEDLTSGWTPNGAGSVTADTITFTAAGGDGWNITGFTGTVGRVYRWSALLSSTAGTHNIRFRVSGAITGNTQITTTPTRITALLTSTTATAVFGIYNGTDAVAGTINCTQMQLEDVTAQTTQTAGEYVSVGVESAPYYHGSMVDGVKCFPTDIDGNPLTTMERYKPETAATNYITQSNNLSAWTPLGTPSATQNAVGPNGQANYAWTLTDNDAAGWEGVQTVPTFAAGANGCLSVLVGKKASSPVYPLVLAYYNAAGGLATGVIVNEVLGTLSAITGGGYAAPQTPLCTDFNDDYWLVSIGMTQAGANLTATCELYAAGSTDGTTLSSAAQGSTVFSEAQFEQGTTVPSSRIATAGAAVTRNADILTYSGGDVPNLKTLMATFRRESGVSSAGWAVALSDGTISNYESISAVSATQARFLGVTGGATQWDVIPSHTAGTTSKAAFSAATNDTKMAKDGVAQTQDTSATVPTVTQLDVGHVAGGFQLNGNVGGIYGWTRNLSQSELNAITA